MFLRGKRAWKCLLWEPSVFSGSSCKLQLPLRCSLRSGTSQDVTLCPMVDTLQFVLHSVHIQLWSSAQTAVAFCPTQQQRRIDSRALCTCCARPRRVLATNLARWWPTLQPNTWEGSMGVVCKQQSMCCHMDILWCSKRWDRGVQHRSKLGASFSFLFYFPGDITTSLRSQAGPLTQLDAQLYYCFLLLHSSMPTSTN